MGQYPEAAVAMLAKIAAVTEPKRLTSWQQAMQGSTSKPHSAAQAMAVVVEHSLQIAPCAAIFVPTRSGDTARMISRFKPSAWIVAVSEDYHVTQGLLFSYGVKPIHAGADSQNWRDFAIQWLREHQVSGNIALLVAAASSSQPDANHRIEFMRVGQAAVATTDL